VKLQYAPAVNCLGLGETGGPGVAGSRWVGLAARPRRIVQRYGASRRQPDSVSLFECASAVFGNSHQPLGRRRETCSGESGGPCAAGCRARPTKGNRYDSSTEAGMGCPSWTFLHNTHLPRGGEPAPLGESSGEPHERARSRGGSTRRGERSLQRNARPFAGRACAGSARSRRWRVHSTPEHLRVALGALETTGLTASDRRRTRADARRDVEEW